MKKLLSFLIASLLLLTCVSGLMTAMAASLPGDVNGDGKVGPEDARLALRASVRLEQYAPGSDAFTAADTNRDGVITAEDARVILRVSVGLESFDGAPKPLTDDEAVQLYIAANDIYLPWLTPMNFGPKYSYQEKTTYNGDTYYRIVGGRFSSKDELLAECRKYFLPEVYTEWVEDYYLQQGDRFYGKAQIAGDGGWQEARMKIVSAEGDVCKLQLTVYYYGSTNPYTTVMTLKWTDGSWKFTKDFICQPDFERIYKK